jgi:hypothetical protein
MKRCMSTLLLVLSVSLAAFAQTPLQLSHIEANVPAPALFRSFLDRDVLAYFNANGLPKADRVEVRLLRDAPTQSGVSCPKYYAWAKIYEGSELRQSGAVRLAAIEKVRFEVTDFVSQSQVRQGSGNIERIFPAALLQAIRQLATS